MSDIFQKILKEFTKRTTVSVQHTCKYLLT